MDNDRTLYINLPDDYDTSAKCDSDNGRPLPPPPPPPVPNTATAHKSNTLLHASAGAAGALLIGGVASYFTSTAKGAATDTVTEIEDDTKSENPNLTTDKEADFNEVPIDIPVDLDNETHSIVDVIAGTEGSAFKYEPAPDIIQTPSWSDGQVGVATGVTDDMSFSQAFAAARAEVGPGGAFEWRGGVYGTYTADEWQQMPASERADYASHFNWDNIDTAQSDIPDYAVDTTGSANNDRISGGNDLTDVVLDDMSLEAQLEPAPDNDIEVLGVANDDLTGAAIGALRVDGQDIYLIDVDNDDKFDYAVADINGDGDFTPDEMTDISGLNVEVSDMMNCDNDLLADAGMSGDYIDDAPIYDI